MTAVSPRLGIQKIKPHMIDASFSEAPETLINISSNESALGPGANAIVAAQQALLSIERYPEHDPEQLAKAIGSTFDLDPVMIVCGHGSDELLARIARAYLSPGDELAYSIHGYQKFPNYAHANDAHPVAAADCEYRADVDSILACVNERTRIVMLANPDNPTGSYVSGVEVRRLLAGLRPDILLVLDSAYAEYVDTTDYEDAAGLVGEFENVVMTRTFSKIFGLAGMRVGWLYGPPAVADVIRRIGTTFPLSAPGIAAAIAAMGDEDHTHRVLEHNRIWKQWLAEQLGKMGLRVYPSETNFLLVQFPDGARPASAANDHLRRKGILARRFPAADFQDCIRFTIGLEDEMVATVASLQEFMGKAD
jgi:histidinol-phosphate aminotransferase